MGFMVNIMALGQAFYGCFGFKPGSVTPLMLPTHLSTVNTT